MIGWIAYGIGMWFLLMLAVRIGVMIYWTSLAFVEESEDARPVVEIPIPDDLEGDAIDAWAEQWVDVIVNGREGRDWKWKPIND